MRKTIITTAVLLLIFIGSGMVYVFITDHASVKPRSVAAVTDAGQSSPLPKPIPPGANAPEGVAIDSVTSPVKVGSNSSVVASTNAGSMCTVTVSYNGVQSTDSGLTPKTADAYGSVSWTWTVGSTVPIGNWPIKVTCTYHGRSAVVLSSLQVTK